MKIRWKKSPLNQIILDGTPKLGRVGENPKSQFSTALLTRVYGNGNVWV
jgi:hypothetical protein